MSISWCFIPKKKIERKKIANWLRFDSFLLGRTESDWISSLKMKTSFLYAKKLLGAIKVFDFNVFGFLCVRGKCSGLTNTDILWDSFWPFLCDSESGFVALVGFVTFVLRIRQSAVSHSIKRCECACTHKHAGNRVGVFLIGAAAEIPPRGLKQNVYVQSIGWLFKWHLKCTGIEGVLGWEKVEGLLKLGHQFVRKQKNTQKTTTRKNSFIWS